MTTYVSGYKPVSDNVRGFRSEDNRQDNQLCTGIWEGGLVTINGSDSTKIDITAGSGVVVDNYTDPRNAKVYQVVWEAKTAVPLEFITQNFTSFIGIARNGEVTQFALEPTASERRDYIILALAVHTSLTTIENISNEVQLGYGNANALNDLSNAIGTVNIDGNVFRATGGNLRLTRSAGKSFKLGGNYYNDAKSPNVINSDALVSPYIFKPYRDGAGNYSIVLPLTQSVDPAYYDDGTGTLALVPASTPWTVLRVYHSPVNDNVIVHYGQTLYANALAAEAAIGGDVFAPNPVLKNTLLRAFIVIRRTCTNLADTATCKIIQADKFGITKSTGATSNVPTLQAVYASSAELMVGDVVTLVDGAFTLQDNNDDANAVMLGIHNFAGDEVFQLTSSGVLAKASFPRGATAARPASPSQGQFFFDTSLNLLITYIGSAWLDAMGNEV